MAPLNAYAKIGCVYTAEARALSALRPAPFAAAAEADCFELSVLGAALCTAVWKAHSTQSFELVQTRTGGRGLGTSLCSKERT